MSRSILRILVLKDLYLTRGMLVAALAAGLLSLAILPWSKESFFVGSLSFMVVMIVLNVGLVMASVLGERKERVAPFILSLPISPTEYAIAKVTASLIAFLGPWLLLTGACVLVILRTPIPDGMIPMTLGLLVYFIFYYCVFLAVALLADSSLWVGAVIVCGNVGVNFVIQILFRMPSVAASLHGEKVVWGADVVNLILAELAASVLALGTALVLHARKRDFA